VTQESDPSFDDLPPATLESQAGDQFSPEANSFLKRKDPPWSGWDVLSIALVAIIVIAASGFVIAYVLHRLFYPTIPLVVVAKEPLVGMLAQMAAYLVVLAFMISIVKRNLTQSFWSAIHWNWPKTSTGYVLGGIVLSFALQGLAHFLPMPKELPIDRFFQTPAEAWTLSLFGITLAPLMEELFFRGFLYPVLVRRMGLAFAIFLTSLAFGLIHAPQLGRAWGPVLVVFLVGLALTIVRATTKSVAPGFLMHIAYNGTISLLLFIVTNGFRHLEKLNR
jgi:membrane protease YdiL (CAAX protease family)